MDVQIYRQRIDIAIDDYFPPDAKFSEVITALKAMGVPKPDSSEPLRFTPQFPVRGSEEAAGYDVFAFIPRERQIALMPLQTTIIPTGLYIAPEALSVVLACSRSGLASKGIHIINAPGIIDSDYRGELKMMLTYIAHPNTEPYIIKHGDRVGQLLFLSPGKVSMGVNFVEVLDTGIDPDKSRFIPSLRPSERGSNGFGSTGR